jgi:hypothetical protein
VPPRHTPPCEIRGQLTRFRHHVGKIGVAEHRGVYAGGGCQQGGNADHDEADASDDLLCRL